MRLSGVQRANRGKPRPLVYVIQRNRYGRYDMAMLASEPREIVRRYLDLGYHVVTESQFNALWTRQMGKGGGDA